MSRDIKSMRRRSNVCMSGWEMLRPSQMEEEASMSL
jgi:hypothetical protein